MKTIKKIDERNARNPRPTQGRPQELNNKYFLWLFLILFIFFIVSLTLGVFVYFPKVFILILLIAISVLIKREKDFFKHWFLFLSIIYLSDTMRGLIYFLISKLNIPVYSEYVVRAEKLLFSIIPSVYLQNKLLPGSLGFLEKFCTFFHGTHFIAFLIVGFFFWFKDLNWFTRYKLSFYPLLLVGLSSYFLIPTAPPWMASELFGLVPDLSHFNLELYNMYLPDLTSGFNTDPVAAMPSLHAAFPFLCCLLLWSKYKLKALAFYLYTGIIIFTIIYTGDHYVVDILAGIVLAYLSFGLSKMILSPKTAAFKRIITGVQPGHKFVRPGVVVGTILILMSIVIGQWIKPHLAEYYSSYNKLNFVDFIKHPEKAEQNSKIALFLGDYQQRQNNLQEALSYYEKARSLSDNNFERRIIDKKIRDLKQ